LLDENYRDKIAILAVSVDPHDKAHFLREKLKNQPGVNFPMLSDPTHRVIDRYGLFNEKSSRALPHPATYVIDREGKVRYRFVEVDYKIRPSNEDILKEVAKLEKTK